MPMTLSRIYPATVVGVLFAATLIQTGAAAANPEWKGRPFVKVLAQLDPIPGTSGAVFTTIERFTLRDGKSTSSPAKARTRRACSAGTTAR